MLQFIVRSSVVFANLRNSAEYERFVRQSLEERPVMLRAKQFRPIAVRLVAFTPNVSDFKHSEILTAVLGKFAQRFSGKIQSIPLPDIAPPDIPRIQLSSRDGAWIFTASPSRLTAAWKQLGEADEVSEVAEVNELVRFCREVIQQNVECNDVQVGRLALVLTKMCHCQAPAQALIDRFCSQEVKAPNSPNAPLRHSRHFELHNHKQYELPVDNLVVNSWVRCKTGAVPGREVVTVEQDINTLAEELETRVFDNAMIERFYGTAVQEAEEILDKYFP